MDEERFLKLPENVRLGNIAAEVSRVCISLESGHAARTAGAVSRALELIRCALSAASATEREFLKEGESLLTGSQIVPSDVEAFEQKILSRRM